MMGDGMSEMNEEKITKCLEALARIDSNPEQVGRDMERTRQRILEEIARPQTHPDNLWRKVMKSNLIKFAIAAIVMIAAVAGFFWMGDGAKLAWAEVAARVEQAGAFSYRMFIQMEGGAVAGMPGGMPEMEGHILISPEFGMKMEMFSGGKVMQQTYVSAAEKGAVMLMPEAKKIMRMQFSEDLLAKMQQQNNDPRYMFKEFMNCQYEELGRTEINGVECEGIRTTDPKYGMGMFQEVSVEIWADVQRGWPVLMEMDATMNSPAGGGLMNMHMVMEDFQWNLEVTAADFTPEIPEDYTAMPDMQVPAMNAEAAIEGLQFYADIVGRYPKKMDMMNMTADFTKLLTQQDKAEVGSKLGMDIEGLSEQEQIEKLMPQMMKIQGIAMFYMAMTQEGRDPKYYGAVVEPGDADAILLGWRRDDGQYDVIYGDLSRGTVAAEEMPEEPVIPGEPNTEAPDNLTPPPPPAPAPVKPLPAQTN